MAQNGRTEVTMAEYTGPERREYDHKCLHEVDLAIIAENIKQILRNQNEQKSIIFGNGKEGLRTIQNRQATMQKIQWWAIGVIILGLSGLAFQSIYFHPM